LENASGGRRCLPEFLLNKKPLRQKRKPDKNFYRKQKAASSRLIHSRRAHAAGQWRLASKGNRMPSIHTYADDDPLAEIYIKEYEAALPASNIAGAGSHPRHWRLAAHAAATAALVEAMIDAKTAAADPRAVA
jgi:hypothetical protein